MAENSKIEWTDHTFNPWTGCTKVSPGCDHCYAESWAKRSGTVRWGAGEPRRRTIEANWRKPLQWNAQAEREGRRFRVFCASLADVFDNDAPEQWRADLFSLIAQTPQLDWLLLTKRIGNAAAMLDRIAYLGTTDSVLERMPLPNVWLGATVVNQEEADRDIQKLLQVPARVRFLSIEPMLGPIDLRQLRGFHNGATPQTHDCLSGHSSDTPWGYVRDKRPDPFSRGRVDWIIVGGESGPGARPMHPDWARSLRDQCKAAGVPFLFKQWGEWADERHARLDQPIATHLRKTVSRLAIDGTVHPMRGPGPESYTGITRVGKKAAGRLLDGVQHDGFPTNTNEATQ